jgi:CO/xanthine dehydrogenase Mo-binding subunit
MLTAVVLHPPRFGATVAWVDAQATLAEPGVAAVVPIGEGVAMVGETVVHAQRGLRALTVEWDDTVAERRSSAELLAEHVRLLEWREGAVVARDDGNAEVVLADAPTVVDGRYALPYLAHAAMEPNNAACRMRADGVLDVWATSVNLPFVRDVMFTNGVDFFTTTGAADPPYAFANFKLESTNFRSGVPTMVWRSVGNSHTEFARESAIDELAIAAGRDPVDLRRELLADNPRTLRALELAAEIAGWDTPAPEGRARGITCSSFLSHCANVTEISLDAAGASTSIGSCSSSTAASPSTRT